MAQTFPHLGKRGKIKVTERKEKGKASNQQKERKGESDKEAEKSKLRINLGRKCMMKDVFVFRY